MRERMRARFHTPAAVTASLLVLAAGCSDGSAITAPLPAVDGTWSVLRTAVNTVGCDVLLDPEPTPFVFRSTDGVLEVGLPLGPGRELILRGVIEADGEFQLHWEEDNPGFASESIRLDGRFVGDALTAIERSETVFIDPRLIELFGSERCETTIRWEGERV
jgi:hypothetical protein